MGTREWILAAIAVLAVYLVFQLIRAMQVKEGPAATKPLGVIKSVPSAGSLNLAKTERTAAPVAAPPADAVRHSPPPAEAATEDFALALEVRQLRRDVSQLREVQDAQRSEIAALRGMLDGQAAALAATRAAQSVSPMYSEALALAQRGMSADVIAERCSISVAEAELVQSLAQEPEKGSEDTP